MPINVATMWVAREGGKRRREIRLTWEDGCNNAILHPEMALNIAENIRAAALKAQHENDILDRADGEVPVRGIYRGLRPASEPIGMDVSDEAPKETPGQPSGQLRESMKRADEEMATTSVDERWKVARTFDEANRKANSRMMADTEAKAEAKVRGIVFEAMQDFLESPAAGALLALVRGIVREEIQKAGNDGR